MTSLLLAIHYVQLAELCGTSSKATAFWGIRLPLWDFTGRRASPEMNRTGRERMKCKMCVSPVNPKCPIRIPVKSTNVTPNDTPKILILPSSTPTDITNAYRQTICATDEGSQRRLSNQFIIPYYNVAFLNFAQNYLIKRSKQRVCLSFCNTNFAKGGCTSRICFE